MKMNRGGKSLKVGNIGCFSVLRQHLLMPGETLTPSIRGNVRLSGLRQQTSVYLHAKIDAFVAPLRWYQTDWPDYIKEGVSTAKTVATLTGTDWTDKAENTTHLGIGHVRYDFAKFYAQHPINIWNEWYRWPEATKFSVTTPLSSFFDGQGQPCTNLASAPTRLHDAPSFDTATEVDVPAAASTMDVRDLALFQGRFAQAARTDWSSQERYNVFMKDVFGAQGNNEVDQVPTRLRSGAELGVSPRDMYASDGPSLGELMSINNFKVSHKWDSYTAQEHMIVCYVMLLRFAPVLEDGVAPGIYPAHTGYTVWQGDPAVLAMQKPVVVVTREIDSPGDANTVGYLPAGWQLRESWDHVDHTIRVLSNFPLMDGQPLTAAGYRDASNINANVFRSTALKHWFADLDFTCDVQGRIPAAGTSIMAGSGKGTKGPKGNHPTGGYLQ